jgi:hypothetical protein
MRDRQPPCRRIDTRVKDEQRNDAVSEKTLSFGRLREKPILSLQQMSPNRNRFESSRERTSQNRCRQDSNLAGLSPQPVRLGLDASRPRFESGRRGTHRLYLSQSPRWNSDATAHCRGSRAWGFGASRGPDMERRPAFTGGLQMLCFTSSAARPATETRRPARRSRGHPGSNSALGLRGRQCRTSPTVS